jgi:hypothetical protein
MLSTPRRNAAVLANVSSVPVLSLARPALSLASAAAWYSVVVLPEAQTVLHRQWHRTDLPPHAPARALPFLSALFYASCLPLAVVLRAAGARAASSVALAAVAVNPPTVLVASVVASEIVCKVGHALRGAMRAAWRALRRAPPAGKAEDADE